MAIPETAPDWEEQTTILNVGPDYYHWREKRDTDIKWCCKVTTTEDPRTGKNRISCKDCEEPDCSNCGPRIREEMAKALNKVLLQHPLRIIKLSGTIEEQKAERARIMRKYGKGKCSAFANDVLSEKGLSVQIEMLIDTKDEIGEPYVSLTADDLYRWSQKSFASKKSGNLHKVRVIPHIENEEQELPPKEEIETKEEVVRVTIEQWKTDCRDKEFVEAIEEEVIRNTNYLNPKTLEELEQALLVRRDVRRRILEDNGIVILSNESFRVTVKMSEVDWTNGKTIPKRPDN